MGNPTFTDYVDVLLNLFERFWQHDSARAHRGHPFVYEQKTLLVFFLLMHQRRLLRFKAQRRWLVHHPELRTVFGLNGVPDRTPLARRYKALYDVLQDCIAFLGTYAEDLDPCLTSEDLSRDKSLCKAQGPVWHQAARQAGRIPAKLRHLDTDGSWSTSGYHGWVYGNGLHLVHNRAGFPTLMPVETASVAATIVIAQQTERRLNDFRPATVTTDQSYTQALRIRQWAKRGGGCLEPPPSRGPQGAMPRPPIALSAGPSKSSGCAAVAPPLSPCLTSWPKPWARQVTRSNGPCNASITSGLAWRWQR